jgi:PilZ domain
MEPKKQRERRLESRRPVFEAAMIKSTISGLAVTQVLNISPSGLRVTAPYPFPVGAEIEVLFQSGKITGSVRNCVRARPTLFHVGIGEARSAPTDSPDRLARYADLDRLTDVLRQTDTADGGAANDLSPKLSLALRR